jgi:hypothetical protein
VVRTSGKFGQTWGTRSCGDSRGTKRGGPTTQFRTARLRLRGGGRRRLPLLRLGLERFAAAKLQACVSRTPWDGGGAVWERTVLRRAEGARLRMTDRARAGGPRWGTHSGMTFKKREQRWKGGPPAYRANRLTVRHPFIDLSPVDSAARTAQNLNKCALLNRHTIVRWRTMGETWAGTDAENPQSPLVPRGGVAGGNTLRHRSYIAVVTTLRLRLPCA